MDNMRIMSGDMPQSTACVGTRANVCDTVKENRCLMGELRCVLDKLECIIQASPVAPRNEALSADPICLLDDVLLQHDMLEDIHCIVKRIYCALNG